MCELCTSYNDNELPLRSKKVILLCIYNYWKVKIEIGEPELSLLRFCRTKEGLSVAESTFFPEKNATQGQVVARILDS